MAVEVASPEELLLKMQEFHQQHAAEMVETAYAQEVTEDAQGERTTVKAKAKQLPRYRLYHLRYDHAGKVVDYHEDSFRVGLDALWRRLQRRYAKNEPGAGFPIWAVKLPEGATKPECTLPCNFPGCGGLFSTPEERELHQRAFHRDWATLDREKQSREERQQQTDQLAMLIQQNQQTQLQLRDLIGGFQEMVGGFTQVISKLVEGRPTPEAGSKKPGAKARR